MARRVLNITPIWWDLENLENAHLFSKMEVYAVIFISGEPRALGPTQANSNGGRNPSQEEMFFFIVPESSAGDLCIVLRTDHALGYSDVGEVRVPLKELFGGGDAPGSGRVVSYPVRKIGSEERRGLLDFSYKLSERIASSPSADEPVTVYPAGADAQYLAPQPYQPPEPPPGSYGYPSPPPPPPPPLQVSYGYPAPPPPHPPPVSYGYPAALPPPPLHPLQVSYGYPAPPPPHPPPVSYGYPAPLPPPPPPPPPHPLQVSHGYLLQWPRRNNFGMGLGAGLVSDDAAAYNAGFGDGGGFHGWIDRGFGF